MNGKRLPSLQFYKFYNIEFSIKKRRERRYPRRDTRLISVFEYSGFFTVFPLLSHAIQGKDRIFILFQEDSSNSTRNTTTTRLIPCRQIQGILQQLFPMHPSIPHGRIRLQAPYSTPRILVIPPAERAF